jgi:hypothetical protein
LSAGLQRGTAQTVNNAVEFRRSMEAWHTPPSKVNRTGELARLLCTLVIGGRKAPVDRTLIYQHCMVGKTPNSDRLSLIAWRHSCLATLHVSAHAHGQCCSHTRSLTLIDPSIHHPQVEDYSGPELARLTLLAHTSSTAAAAAAQSQLCCSTTRLPSASAAAAGPLLGLS